MAGGARPEGSIKPPFHQGEIADEVIVVAMPVTAGAVVLMILNGEIQWVDTHYNSRFILHTVVVEMDIRVRLGEVGDLEDDQYAE